MSPSTLVKLCRQCEIDALLGEDTRILTVDYDRLMREVDDYVKNVNSPKQIDEVTYVQFRNALGRTGLEVSGDETELIAMKFPGKVRLGLGLGVRVGF